MPAWTQHVAVASDKVGSKRLPLPAARGAARMSALPDSGRPWSKWFRPSRNVAS